MSFGSKVIEKKMEIQDFTFKYLRAFIQSSRNFACVVGAVSVGTVCHSETVDLVMWKLMQAESTGVQIF